ncbi:MAG: M81 family metallopeptidase [Planctomycetota bacterium]
MPRVGILALIQESNTFLSGTTTFDHFRQDLLLTSEDVRRHFATAHHEVRGFFDGLARAGIEAVPIFAARALPFGTIESDAFERLVQQMIDELESAGRLDGILVAPHGATVAASHPDADGYWLSLVRQTVGPQIPIIGTLDPHGNLSPQMVAATDALMAYHTNPHIDQEQRGVEAAELMARTLRGEVTPVQAACFPPMVINIERQCTSEPPLTEVVADFEAVRGQIGVLSASLMLGFPYADVSEMGASSLVVTNGNPSLAQSLANQLAESMWRRRSGLAGSFISVEDAVTRAQSLPAPICMLDMGDNVGGGSPGNGTWLAHELQRQKVGPSFLCLYDPTAVMQADAVGVGAKVRLAVGGKTDDFHGSPFQAAFLVKFVGDGRFAETQVRHGGFTGFDQGHTAIVETDDGLLTIMLTTRRTPPFSLRQLTAFGLEPQSFRVLVAKGVNAPLAAYQPVCPTILRVNTRGVTTADVTQLPYQHRRKPMFPFEVDTIWIP